MKEVFVSRFLSDKDSILRAYPTKNLAIKNELQQIVNNLVGVSTFVEITFSKRANSAMISFCYNGAEKTEIQIISIPYVETC